MSLAQRAMTSDEMPRKFKFKKNYSVTIENSDSWIRGVINFPIDSLTFYTDGAKMDGKVGAGVFGPHVRISAPMGSAPTVFQAEISDSRAALLALNSCLYTSRLVWETALLLDNLASVSKVTLMWVPGHSNIEGNEMADQLAKEEGAKPFKGPEPFCAYPKSHYRMDVLEWGTNQRKILWENLPGLRQSKRLIHYSRKWSMDVISLSKNELRKYTGTVTGH